MDALRGQDSQPAVGAGEGLGVLGPHARRVDDGAGADRDAPARLEVLEDRAVDRARRALGQLDDLGPGRGVCPVGGRGADQGGDQACVVDRGVPVLDGTDRGVVREVGELALHLLAREVAVQRQRPLARGHARERVVQRDPGADVGTLPHAVLERVQERDRAHEVRREVLDEQVALGQRLVDQVEVEHLQVAQPAVDQLARPARRTGGPVLTLDDRGREPTGHGVEGDARSGHASADHEDVELLVRAGARLER
ncbi:hypothetical protein D3C74_306600 [compost metagenome]